MSACLLLAAQRCGHVVARSDTHYTYCPYKGECTYYSVPIGGSKSVYAVWTYEKPYEAVADIKEHLAFYPSRVHAIDVNS
jgi:uncharacterized protein (DUF427 family)